MRTLLAILLCAFSASAVAVDASDIMVKVTKDGFSYIVNAEFSVPVKPDEAWDVLVDFDKMAQILSNVDASKIVSRTGDRLEVAQKSHAMVGLIKVSLDSVRQVDLVPKTEIRSHLVKGELKSSDFTTKLLGEGAGTKVTVQGSFVPQGLGAAVVNPEAVEAQTRHQYQELRDEIMRRKNGQPTPPCILAKNCPQN
jgi:carbon monoxide dehydrogenase subunit G